MSSCVVDVAFLPDAGEAIRRDVATGGGFDSLERASELPGLSNEASDTPLADGATPDVSTEVGSDVAASVEPKPHCHDGEFLCVDGELYISSFCIQLPGGHCLNECDELWANQWQYYFPRAEDLCHFPSAELGDPCRADSECAVWRALVDETNIAQNKYQVCKQGMCSEGSPPQPDDLGEHCSVSGSYSPSYAMAGYESDDCMHGLCAVSTPFPSDEGPLGCVASACTMTCAGDHTCPPGAACTEVADPESNDFVHVCLYPGFKYCGD